MIKCVKMSYDRVLHQKLTGWIALLCVVNVTVGLGTAASEKSAAPVTSPKPGTTQIARWKDNKKAVFLLMFDDNVASHFQTVIPELSKRGFRATFYVNPGTGTWQSAKDEWEVKIPAIPNVVYANHTWTHKGIMSLESAEEEIGKANEVLHKLSSNKKPRLLSFGRPGVGPEQWTISEADLKRVLDRHNLVERPAAVTQIAMAPLNTSAGMLGLADRAIADGGMGGIVFHGVGAEWIVTPIETFNAFLDGLQVRRDKLWITDHISAHQYETERSSAVVEVRENFASRIRLRLQTTANSQLFDLPLTLITQVKASWKKCEVVQGNRKKVVAATGNKLMFEALPNSEIITIRRLVN